MVGRGGKLGRGRATPVAAEFSARSSKGPSRASSHTSHADKSSTKHAGKQTPSSRRGSLVNSLSADAADDSDLSMPASSATSPLSPPTLDEAYQYLLQYASDSAKRPELLRIKQSLDVVDAALTATRSAADAKLAQLHQWRDQIHPQKSIANGSEHISASPPIETGDTVKIKTEVLDSPPATDTTQIKLEESTQEDSQDVEMEDAATVSAEGAATAALLSSESAPFDGSQTVVGATVSQVEHSQSQEQQSHISEETRSLEILGLFKEDPGNTTIEYLRAKYGVGSFPSRDLKDLLPGAIPDQDFTRAKPPNQVQLSTFSTTIEPYFRSYVEEDVSFLKQRAVGAEGLQYSRQYALSPYLIPPLGPYYGDVWTEEDNAVGHKMTYTPNPTERQKLLSALQPRGNEDGIAEGILESEKLSCGPLASRLLSALLNEIPKDSAIKSEFSEISAEDGVKNPAFFESQQQGWKVDSIKSDYASLEDRLKREFRYVGILDVNLLHQEEKKKKALVDTLGPVGGATIGAGELNGVAQAQRPSIIAGSAVDDDDDDDDDDDPENYNIDWVNGREDDEICVEMRGLQNKLREVTKINQACKRRLIPLVQEQMAYQEYAQILDDLDKQVDQAYLKRIRNIPKGKKKKAAQAAQAVAAATAAAAVAVNGTNDSSKPGLRALLDKRQRWIDKIGPVFRPPEIMKRMPEENVFDNIEVDVDEEEDDEDEDDDGVTV